MKTLNAILLLIALAVVTQYASAQKNDFSDWNVPPPITPGGISSGINNKPINKTIVIPALTDVLPPGLPKTVNVQLAELTPIQLTPPDVIAPDQPVFPDLPFATPDIPLPAAPDKIGLPKNAPQDEPVTDGMDIPLPTAPEMPDFPKVPNVSPGRFPDVPVPIPLVPDVLNQPLPGLSSAMPFPFIEWTIPPIPLNVHFGLVLPVSPATIKPKPRAKRKPKKTTGGSN